MNTSRILNVGLILIGALVALYAQAGADQNQYILIGGIVLLMTGIYRVSRNIPSKNNQEQENNKED